LFLGVVTDAPHFVGAGDFLRHLEHDPADVDLAGVQIDVNGAQRRKLTPTDAGLDRDQREDAIPLRDLGQHRLELLRRDRPSSAA
jgi:hypothetical protein